MYNTDYLTYRNYFQKLNLWHPYCLPGYKQDMVILKCFHFITN